jgi:hypothetical protein
MGNLRLEIMAEALPVVLVIVRSFSSPLTALPLPRVFQKEDFAFSLR